MAHTTILPACVSLMLTLAEAYGREKGEPLRALYFVTASHEHEDTKSYLVTMLRSLLKAQFPVPLLTGSIGGNVLEGDGMTVSLSGLTATDLPVRDLDDYLSDLNP